MAQLPLLVRNPYFFHGKRKRGVLVCYRHHKDATQRLCLLWSDPAGRVSPSRVTSVRLCTYIQSVLFTFFISCACTRRACAHAS